MSDPRDLLVARLKDAAHAVASGDYAVGDTLDALAEEAGVPADLADLARTFALMAVKVEAREFQLSNTVEDLKEARRRLEALSRRLDEENRTLKANAEQLRIVVDHEDSAREIAEIESSDYFQGLVREARRLRRPDGEGDGGGPRPARPRPAPPPAGPAGGSGKDRP